MAVLHGFEEVDSDTRVTRLRQDGGGRWEGGDEEMFREPLPTTLRHVDVVRGLRGRPGLVALIGAPGAVGVR